MRYWPSSELANAPGMHPHAAHELAAVNRTGVISARACEAGHMAVINDIVLPFKLPLAVPPTLDAYAQSVYLRMPTLWEFYKLERAGIMDLDGQFYFSIQNMH